MPSRLPERLLRAMAARGEKGVRVTIASYGAVWRFGPLDEAVTMVTVWLS
jgi:hypothetical protein